MKHRVALIFEVEAEDADAAYDEADAVVQNLIPPQSWTFDEIAVRLKRRPRI